MLFLSFTARYFEPGGGGGGGGRTATGAFNSPLCASVSFMEINKNSKSFFFLPLARIYFVMLLSCVFMQG